MGNGKNEIDLPSIEYDLSTINFSKTTTHRKFIRLLANTPYLNVFNWQLDGSDNNQYLDLPVCLLGSDWLNAGGVSARWIQ